ARRAARQDRTTKRHTMTKNGRRSRRARLARLEGKRGEGGCSCPDPIRVSWTGQPFDEKEGAVCGGGLLFGPLHLASPPSPAEQGKRRKTFKRSAAKAEGGKVDLGKLTKDEVADLREAMTAQPEEPKPAEEQTSPLAWRSKATRDEASILDMEF